MTQRNKTTDRRTKNEHEHDQEAADAVLSGAYENGLVVFPENDAEASAFAADVGPATFRLTTPTGVFLLWETEENDDGALVAVPGDRADPLL